MNGRTLAVLAAAVVALVVVEGCGGTAQQMVGGEQEAHRWSPPAQWAQGIALAGLGPVAEGKPGGAAQPPAGLSPVATPSPRAPMKVPAGAPKEATSSGSLSSDLGLVAQTPADMTIENPVSAFYGWYLGFSGDPLESRAYRTERHLTRSLTQRVDSALIKSELDLHASHIDPFVCGQTRAIRVEPGAVRAFGDEAQVEVRVWYRSGPPATIQLRVVSTGGTWQVDGISCPAPAGK